MAARNNGSATEDADGLAQKQVDAFMAHLQERLGIDEDTMRTIASKQKKNGRVYVTWAAILSAVMVVAGYLAQDKIANQDRRITIVEEKQQDVRERLSRNEGKDEERQTQMKENRDDIKRLFARINALSSPVTWPQREPR